MGWGVHDYPSPPDEEAVICPICGFDAKTFYRNLNGEIIGCDQCVEAVDAQFYWEEQREIIETEKYDE